MTIYSQTVFLSIAARLFSQNPLEGSDADKKHGNRKKDKRNENSKRA